MGKIKYVIKYLICKRTNENLGVIKPSNGVSTDISYVCCIPHVFCKFTESIQQAELTEVTDLNNKFRLIIPTY